MRHPIFQSCDWETHHGTQARRAAELEGKLNIEYNFLRNNTRNIEIEI